VPVRSPSRALALAAITSLGAGAIRGRDRVHSEHRQAVITFTILAIAQLGWGAFALHGSEAALVLAGASINLRRVRRLDHRQDGRHLVCRRAPGRRARSSPTRPRRCSPRSVLAQRSPPLMAQPPAVVRIVRSRASLIVAVVTAFGMVSAGSHTHAHGAAGTRTAPAGRAAPHLRRGRAAEGIRPEPADRPAASRASRPRSGAPRTGRDHADPSAQFSDYRTAEADGFASIGDGFTATSTSSTREYFDDGRVLDPDHPESLVYDARRQAGARVGDVHAGPATRFG
jgi:hypothetical protein